MSLFDEAMLSREEATAVAENAKDRFHLWRSVWLFLVLGFLLNCGLVVPFLSGNPFHTYWEPFGTYLLLVAMGIFPVFVYCVAMLLTAWILLREAKKTGARHIVR